jgi:integrase
MAKSENSARKNLTEKGIEKIKPPKDRQFDSHYDAIQPGLVLRVNAGGTKSWNAQYYLKRVNEDGKRVSIPTSFKLGLYPTLSVKQAREKARVFLADPQKALAQADSGNFKEVAETFIKRHVEANKLRTQADIKRVLNKYILPEWQHRPFREIKRGDVASLLDKIEDKHGARQADIVLAIIRKMMNWYATRNDDYVSPVVRGMHRHNAGEHKRRRILNDDEIRALWKVDSVFGAIVKVLLLTAQRRDKVKTMKWSDISDGVWTIATEAREKANAGSLRLPQTVLDIIKAQPKLANNPFVFAGSTRGERKADTPLPPFNSFCQRKAELDKKLKIEPWTIHDLRRTAKSLMARAGVRPDISERVLGHAISGVEGVYDRHDYDAEKADALKRLADMIENITNPPEGNVVSLRR